MASADAFRAWYIRVRGLELGCVLSCMGRAMQSSGALQNWPAQGSQPPDAMQKCLLLEMLANARLKIDDISTDGKYKKQDDDWWQEQGFRLISRLKAAFGGTDGAGGDPGKVTSSMSARKNFRFKSCRSILEKVPLKSGANQVDLAKASEVAVDLHEHCTLVLKYRAT